MNYNYRVVKDSENECYPWAIYLGDAEISNHTTRDEARKQAQLLNNMILCAEAPAEVVEIEKGQVQTSEEPISMTLEEAFIEEQVLEGNTDPEAIVKAVAKQVANPVVEAVVNPVVEAEKPSLSEAEQSIIAIAVSQVKDTWVMLDVEGRNQLRTQLEEFMKAAKTPKTPKPAREKTSSKVDLGFGFHPNGTPRKSAKTKKVLVNPSNPSETWKGSGSRPVWAKEIETKE